MTMTVIGGILFLFFVFAFTNASAFIADQTTVNRATLHLAPLMVCYMTLAFEAFARRFSVAPNRASARACLTARPPFNSTSNHDAAFRSHDLRERVPALPRPAHRRQAGPAVVRRLRRRVGDVPRLLPDHAAAGLRVRGHRGTQAHAARADAPARRAAGGEPRLAADRAGRVLEADRRRAADLPHPRHARVHHRASVFPAVDDEPAAAGVVRAPLPRTQSVSPVRAVESRVAARAARLSVPARAVGRHAHAGARLVGGLRALRRRSRRRRVVEPQRRDCGAPVAHSAGSRSTTRRRRPRGRSCGARSRQPAR